ncbi:MAG: endonuclease/exonuclease/phosphatase family protein [Patescibacteria group bacterium]
MKIITLNTWGGRVHSELINFLSKNLDVDVFCFQEIYHRATYNHMEQGGLDPSLTLFDDIEKALPNHKGYFRAHNLETYGLAMFVKKGMVVELEDECFVHKFKGYIPGEEIARHARNLQVVVLRTSESKLNVFNFHGLWNGGGKTDSTDRLNQSKKLIEYVKKFRGAKVICGDFNLEPQTESIKMIENLPMRNLIKEYGVISTRTSFYAKDIRFADYVFVSDEVKIIDFRVLAEEVSDHSAIELEISVGKNN